MVDVALTEDPFLYGVASGDPLPEAVVIWTRVEVGDSDFDSTRDSVSVAWEVAEDDSFTNIVVSGRFETIAEHGHSVHVDVLELNPATNYHYRFLAGGWTSPVGGTRTAPAAEASPEEVGSVRLAVASCQAFKSGYFSAYEHLTTEEVDAVVFVGDYIYELEAGTLRDHGLDIPTTLDDYRAYYAVARREPQLAAAHARHPWIVIWDDHEVEDNYAAWEPGGVGAAIDPNAAESFRARRNAAYQAWWEFMPVRTGPPAEGELEIYRRFRFGTLADLMVLDTRQYRSSIVSGEGNGNLPRFFGGGPQLDGAFDPNRTMLGARQEEWLDTTLDDSVAADTAWTLLAQTTVLAEVDRDPSTPDKGFSMDAWDGYVANRDRLLASAEAKGVANLVSLGGDIHASAVTDLLRSYHDSDAPAVGTEFIAPSVTSLELLLPEFVEGSLSNPHVHLYETQHRGYLVVEATPEELRAEYRWVASTETASSPLVEAPSYKVRFGSPGAIET